MQTTTHPLYVYSEKYVFSVTAMYSATSYANSAVNGQMNACMTVQSFSILFGFNVTITRGVP